jgi:hypothetical protein
VKSARFRREPDFMHRRLEIDDQLRAILEFQRQDIAAALEFDIGFRAVHIAFDGRQHCLGEGQVFVVGHAKLRRLIYQGQRCEASFG